jgi:predicted DsbA family dithiol-disulfide isomerase
MFAADGLPVSRDLTKVPNSHKALRLGELARERGRHAELHRRLFDAYWARGLDIGDDDVLVAEAEAAGLDPDEAREVLASDRYADVVARETETALDAGATGVPGWVIDERVLVPGAQPHDVFERVLERLGHEPSGS